MDDAVGWIVAISFAYFTYRYFFSSSAGASSTTTTRRFNVPSSSIETVQSMFPHIPSNSIKYELERTRGNVEATVERCLRDGRLPDPPASFFIDETSTTHNALPNTPRRPQSAATPQTPTSASSTATTPSPSLIRRLNLQDRLEVSSPSLERSSDVKGKGKAAPAWEGSAEAREKSLRERKERMVLEARRKLLEKEQAKKAAA